MCSFTKAFAACLTGTFLATTFVEAAEWQAPGPNIALGKPYQLPKKPSYGPTSDPGDATQLTDGNFSPTSRPIWYFKPTVGWTGYVTPMIFDLGSDQPIAGIGYHTDAGLHGPGWPPAILIFVSNDNKDFHYAGELIALASKFGIPADRGGHHFFRTDELKTHGRYVQLIAFTSIFTLVDEVEIYQGQPEFLQIPLPGEPIVAPAEVIQKNKMPYAMAARLATDTARAARLIKQLNVKPELEAKLAARLEELRVAAVPLDKNATYDVDFRAMAPLNAEHAKTFSVLSEAYRSVGYPEYTVWHNNRWNRQSPFSAPPPLDAGKLPEIGLNVKLLQNDRRGEALNIGNFTDNTKSAIVSISGLPGGSQPKYLKLRNAEYIAMQTRIWDADVLPLAEATGSGWKINLPAGMSRQIWLDFNVDAQDCPVGTHQGNVEIQVEGGPKLSVPITLSVAPYRLPDANQKAVAVGVWDFTDLGGCGGLINSKAMPLNRNRYKNDFENMDAVVKHLRESGISAPWGRSDWRSDGTFPRPTKEWFDPQGNLIKPIDFTAFDQWVSMWPGAKYYAIHAVCWWEYAGVGKETVSTREFSPEVTRRLGLVMKEWAAHMRQQGIDPSKIILLLHDEPSVAWQANLTSYWAEAIKAAVPEFKFYVDPMVKPAGYNDPAFMRMFSNMDVITPGTDYSYHHFGQTAVDYYEQWRQKGKIMGFYSCAQNPSEAESVRYYRLQQIACWKISGGAPESWAGFWGYCDVRGVTPWNQLAGSGQDRNWCPAYLDTKGATDGKHWLAIFEGVNDYEYLLILKNRINELERAGQTSDALTAASKVLAEVPDQIIENVRQKNDVAACDNGRIQVLDALLSLAPNK